MLFVVSSRPAKKWFQWICSFYAVHRMYGHVPCVQTMHVETIVALTRKNSLDMSKIDSFDRFKKIETLFSLPKIGSDSSESEENGFY